jgi:hypothetical protein
MKLMAEGAHLRGNDEVALILAVFIIDQDIHAPVAGFLDDFLNGDEDGGFVIVRQEALQLAERFGGGVPLGLAHVAQCVGMEPRRTGKAGLGHATIGDEAADAFDESL